MRILGVDPGTHVTGYGLVEVDDRSGAVRHLTHGVVRTRAADPLWERIGVIHQAIAAVVAEWSPGTLSLERCFVSKNVDSALKLGHTRGAIMVACRGLDVAEYAPSEIKSAVTGSGRAEKTQVAEMVRVLLRLEAAAQADASDALAAAICHAHGRRARAALARAAGPGGWR